MIVKINFFNKINDVVIVSIFSTNHNAHTAQVLVVLASAKQFTMLKKIGN